MQTMETSDDVITWAAGFASRDVMEVLAGNPAFMVSMVIEKELLASLTDNDSGS